MDRIDRRIVDLLQNNARLSNKELAAAVGLAPSSCLARVRRLAASGVFTGFHAEVDVRQMGMGLQALISIRLRRHSRTMVDRFSRYVRTIREVLAVYHVGGRADFLLHVAVRDADHLRELDLGALATRPEVAHMETAIVFEYVRVGTAARPRGSATTGPIKHPRATSGASKP